MAEKDEIQKRIKEEIARLDKESAKAYQEQLKALNAINASLDTYESLLGNIKDDIADIDKGFSGVLNEIQSINSELGKKLKSVKDATKALKGLESISQKLKYDQQGYNELSLDQLKNERSKLGTLENQARNAAKRLAQEKGIVDLAHTNLSFRRDLTEEERAILRVAQEGFKVYEETNRLLKERIKEEEKVNRKLGVTGVLLQGMSKIPIVGPLLKTNEALDAAREKAKAGGGAFATMGTAMASMGKGLLSSLMDPLTIVGLIVKAFQFLLELGFKFDKQITSLQKTLYLSKTEADLMHDSFIEMNKNQEVLVKGFNTSLFLLEKEVEAANQLGTSFGFITRVTKEEVQNQIILTQQIGLSAEEANNLYVLARQNNMTQEDITQEVIKQVNTVKKQTGVTLDMKKVLQDVSKISGQLRLQYANNPKLLAAAVIQAQKLGFTLEQTKKIAEGLLNFEESIENELAAELLIGRDLNLEQARLLALNGKSAEAVALLAKEMGGAAGFASMNVIQQEALAKALGMNADELANSMMTQENMAKLGAEDKKRLEEEVEKLKEKGMFEEAAQLERAAANGANIEAAAKQISLQEEFNNNLIKIQESLSALVKGPAMALANTLATVLTNTKVLKEIFYQVGMVIANISLASMIRQLLVASVAAGTLSALTAGIASALTLGLAAIAIVGAIAAIGDSIESAKSKLSTPPAGATKAATGGVVRSRIDNVTVGEGGPEAIIPLSSPSAKQMMGGGPIQVTVYGQIDKQTLFTFMAEGERTNSNNLGPERQINNRGIQ
jgi:hypothetical protein